MYTVLIVEDEMLELHALTKLVGAHVDRIGSIYQARDSQEALSLTRAHMPDIILMDINIPGCSGLEVLETLRNEGYSGAVVIITAYSQFEYAQIALRINAIDYLLKPIDSCELNACLQKVCNKLDAMHKEQNQISYLQNRIHSITSYLQPIALKSLFNGESAESTMQTLFDWPKDGLLQAAALRFTFEKALDTDEQKCFYYDFYSLCPAHFSLIASINPNEILFAIHSSNRIEDAQFELNLWCIAVRMLQFSNSRSSEFRLTGSKIFNHYQDFASFDRNCPPDRHDEIIHISMDHINRQTLLSVKDLRMCYSKALMRCKAGMPEKVVPIFKSLLTGQNTQWAGLFCVLDVLRAADPGTNVLDAFQTACQHESDLSAAITAWIEENVLRTDVVPHTSSNGFIIEQALEIIRNEYSNPMLSQADIAEHLGLSHAYFSRLFKKEVGETFISYLTQTRLTRAKHLLCEGESIQCIAEACGYQSKKYFMDAFRQNLGLTVAQYLDGVSKS